MGAASFVEEVQRSQAVASSDGYFCCTVLVQGVKANVLFCGRKPASVRPWTQALWVYDVRINQPFTLKTRPLQSPDLDDVVACYRPGCPDARAATGSESTPSGGWRAALRSFWPARSHSHTHWELQLAAKTSWHSPEAVVGIGLQLS